ncbi:MAG: metalloregulator ArsR/SmtB family transcription factor [Chloroflexi bacterium]|nr:metalloregulator ArsR/SmtB family transcription factor [Chloroflexota bacterium]
MTIHDPMSLVVSFKALADPARLKIVRILARAESNVKDLAAALGLTEPTVSHHLNKLREVGFVHLRMEANQHFYRLNPDTLKRFKAQVAELEKASPTAIEEADDAWLNSLDMSVEDKKVLREHVFAGRIRQMPAKHKKQQVILHWLATLFEKNRTYTEPEVNAIIQRVYSDYATLRRDLIDLGYLRREKGGQSYWVTPDDEAKPG